MSEFEGTNDDLYQPGWDAIESECKRVYRGKKAYDQFVSIIKWRFGGNDPIDAVKVYDSGDYWHFVTFGMTELYRKEFKNKDVSGYGMEFTFKLKKGTSEDRDYNEMRCAVKNLQTIARVTFSSGEIFLPYEYLYTGQTIGIDYNHQSSLTGFITVPDDKFRNLDTENGRMQFVEFIGVTDRELRALLNKELNVKSLFQKLGSDVTDYNRKSVI